MSGVEIFGYFGAILIGLTLGLFGGGGSILTVPILVYLMGLNPLIATAYSLFVVGVTSFVGSVKNITKNKVNIGMSFMFGIPAMIATFFTRAYLVSLLPDTVIGTSSFSMSKEGAIMILFAVVMILAAGLMIFKSPGVKEEDPEGKCKCHILVMQGVAVGFISGLVGAGGGFLIVPALVFVAKVPMKKAVATSLLIITMSSLIGFTGDVIQIEVDWYFLLTFSALSIIGIFVGTRLQAFINPKQLKKTFGVFILLMGAVIILKELIL